MPAWPSTRVKLTACLLSGCLSSVGRTSALLNRAPLQIAKPQLEYCRSRGLSTTACSMSSVSYPKPHVQAAWGKHSATLIMLHGLGDSGEGWADIGPQFAGTLRHVKFIFPTAPERPITVNGGMRMNGWYDITSLDKINRQEDEQGVQESARYIEELVAAEVAAGIPSKNVVVAGFSQGGAIALMMLRSSTPLAAVVGMSTYLPLANANPLISPENAATPVLMCHGDADQVVFYDYGKDSFAKLKAAGADIDFKTYSRMGHSAVPEELKAVLEFIASKIPA